jgi:chemotaxis protein CheX
MATEASYVELSKRYGLEPIPESVARLTKLVSRQDADLDEIAKVIKLDKALTLRLLRAANPRAESDADMDIDDVESALMRTGLGCVLLLAMGAPLTVALVKAFQTMLEMKIESVHPNSEERFTGEHVLGTIAFTGRAEGEVSLSLSLEGSKNIASKILGIPPNEIDPVSDVNDAIGEMLNIVTGNLKSNLCDAGLDCKLQPPVVKRVREFVPETISGGGLERMAFRGPQITMFVDVTVNPFAADE